MYTGERRPTGSVTDGPLPVHITGISINFFSLMWLLVKIALAAIPAAFIVAVIWSLAATFLAGIISSLSRSATGL